MIPVIRQFMSSDVPSLEDWEPAGADFGLTLRMIVGPDDGPGDESFDLMICTGGWLAALASAEGVVDARHHLVVSTYDWNRIREYLEKRVAECSGPTWVDVAGRLARLGHWEFEDYTT